MSPQHASSSPSSPAEPSRNVIVGGGPGGLALAIRLHAVGRQVTLLEKREKIGGRAYQFEESDCTFDMGPSLITAAHTIDSVFQSAGRRMEDSLELIPLDPYHRIYFHDGTHIDGELLTGHEVTRIGVEADGPTAEWRRSTIPCRAFSSTWEPGSSLPSWITVP